jgi:phosphatase NudJ
MPPNERWSPRVTVAAVIERDGRYLLVEERTGAGLQLNNPAGHLDPGESPQQGAEREAFEETARRFTAEALLGVYLTRSSDGGDDVTYLRFAFRGRVGEPEPGAVLDEPVVRTLWLTLDEVRASAPRHRSPLVLRCIEDHAAGLRYPLQAVTTHPSVHAAAKGAPG